MSIRTLVTGGTGFLGAYIIQELVEQGHRVKAIRRSDKLPFYIPASTLNEVEWVQGDVLDPIGLDEAMEGMDATVHAAAIVSFRSADRKAMFQTNIEGTGNVVNAALSRGIARFLHVSSVAAIGRTGKEETVTEERKWQESKWNTAYAISKYHAEMEVWRAMAEGLPATIVNPSTILGYGDWNASSCAIFKSAYREMPWFTNGVKGFVDVRDVARAVVTLIGQEPAGERFILNGDNVSFRELFTTMANAFGKRGPVREATPLLSEIAWRLEGLKTLITGKPSLITRESARMAQTSTRYDSSRVLRQLPGFAFTPLQQTVRQACEAYLNPVQPL